MTKACVFALDDNYVLPFFVFFYTLIKTGGLPSDVQIVILHTDTLTERGRSDVKKFIRSHRRSAIFVDTRPKLPDNLPIAESDHVSIATFYRLFIADILPTDIETAVYLDCDMLAMRSISELFDTNVGTLVAAVDHMRAVEGFRLWGDLCGEYFNAGTLVIPVQRWRERDVAHTFIQIIERDASLIKWWDQDILNLAFKNQWQKLPVWYNVCGDIQSILPVGVIQGSAKVIHYTGSIKPWSHFDSGPYASLWDEAYFGVFGQPFDRRSLLPPWSQRLKSETRSRIRFLIYGKS